MLAFSWVLVSNQEEFFVEYSQSVVLKEVLKCYQA